MPFRRLPQFPATSFDGSPKTARRHSRSHGLMPVALATALGASLLLPTSAFAGPADAEGTATPATRIPDAAFDVAAQLRERALGDRTGWDVVESLTTEIGPRLAGSEADMRAVRWAEATFKAVGYDRVWLEPVDFPKWVRRSERAEVLGANAQPLNLTALGGSPGGTVEGEIVRFADLAALEAAPAGSLAGKIAFVDYTMQRAKDGNGYGPASRIRSRGPSAAIRAGAIGYLMRSAGTEPHRFAHTGITRFDEGLNPIPSAALAMPDAEQLTRLLARGAPVRVRLALDCGWDGTARSYNVIGEVTGRDRRLRDEVVVIAAHLDSWDLGTGAIDDGAGIGITMAAGALIARLPKAQRPPRTIRVIAFANEEQGLHGGKVYAANRAAAGEIARQHIAAESDFGAGRIYAIDSNAAPHAQAAIARIAEALAPLGIVHAPGTGSPGPDLIPLSQTGGVWAELSQDGTDYFDYHHTPDDTLDKIDPQALAQNVAAYTVFAYLAAMSEGGFGSAPKPAASAP